MKTGSLLAAALGLVSATAALAQQCTYLEGGVVPIQSTFCNASTAPGSTTNYAGVYDLTCKNPDGSYSTPTNDGYSMPGTGICEYSDACISAAYAYCELNPSNPAGCAATVVGCLPNYCPPVFDFEADTDFDTIWAQPEVTNQESFGTGITINGVPIPINICLSTGMQVATNVYLDCGYQCSDVCDDGVEVAAPAARAKRAPSRRRASAARGRSARAVTAEHSSAMASLVTTPARAATADLAAETTDVTPPTLSMNAAVAAVVASATSSIRRIGAGTTTTHAKRRWRIP